MMHKFIFLITLICLSFNAWADETLEEMLVRIEKEEAIRKKTPEYKEAQKMCKAILKHEVNERENIVLGARYTKEGFAYMGNRDIKIKCKDYLPSNTETYQVYQHPLDKNKFLFYAVMFFSSRHSMRWEGNIYTLDKNSCKVNDLQYKLGPLSSRFTFAIYNNNLYSIVRDYDVGDLKNGKFGITYETEPYIFNLSDESEKYKEIDCN